MNISTIIPQGCVRFGHIEKIICLPVKRLCDNTVKDGILVECGQQHNCNPLCSTDEPYFIPAPDGKKIMIQTNFNQGGQTGGWGDWIHIRLTDQKGNVLIPEKDHTDFGVKWITGRSSKHHYQTIEINFDSISQTCFGFRIYTNKGDETCTQIFRKVTCENVVSIESIHKGFDCWNNYYGLPVGQHSGTSFAYSNKIYLVGLTKYFGGNVDIENNDIKEFLRFYPGEKIAPFMMKYLLNKILSSKRILLNGEEYNNTGSGNFSPVGFGNMFFPSLEFERKCTSGNSLCT